MWHKNGPLLVLALLVVATGGYWLGSRRPAAPVVAPPQRLVPDAALREAAQAARPDAPDAGDDADVRAIRARLQVVIYQRRPGVVPPWQVLSLRRYEFAGRPEWWLDDPHLRADDAVCEGLYGTLMSALVVRRLSGALGDAQAAGASAGASASAAAARYGLSDDKYRLRVVLRGGFELRLGDDAQDGQVYAATRGGDADRDVLVVERHLLEVLSGDRARFSRWNLTLRDFAPESVKSLTLGGLELVRRPAGWEARERGGARRVVRARAELVEQALQTLRTARAVRHLEGPGLRFDEPPGGSTIRLDGQNQLYVGLPCPGDPKLGLVLRVDGGKLCFERSALEALMPSLESLWEPRLLPFSPTALRRVAVGLKLPGQDGRAEIIRGGDGSFTLDGAPADGAAARGYLAELAGVTGLWAPPGPAPSSGGSGVIEVDAAGAGAGAAGAGAAGADATTDRVVLRLLGVGPDGRAWLQRDAEPALLIPTEGLSLFAAAGLRARSPRLLAVRPEQLTTLRVERRPPIGGPGGASSETAAREPGVGPLPLGEGFRLSQPASAPADVELMSRLLGSFVDLQASRLVAKSALAAHGLGAPTARFELALQSGATQHLVVGADAGAGCYARGDGPAVGLLGQELCADLRRPLASRLVLLLDDARVTRVTWERPGQPPRVLVHTDAGGYTLDGAAVEGGPVLGPLHALRRLQVARYGAVGGAPLLTVRVVHGPTPATPVPAAPTSSVPPAEQVVSLYRDGKGHVAQLAGRPVIYQIPDGADPLRLLPAAP